MPELTPAPADLKDNIIALPSDEALAIIFDKHKNCEAKNPILMYGLTRSAFYDAVKELFSQARVIDLEAELKRFRNFVEDYYFQTVNMEDEVIKEYLSQRKDK